MGDFGIRVGFMGLVWVVVGLVWIGVVSYGRFVGYFRSPIFGLKMSDLQGNISCLCPIYGLMWPNSRIRVDICGLV